MDTMPVLPSGVVCGGSHAGLHNHLVLFGADQLDIQLNTGLDQHFLKGLPDRIFLVICQPVLQVTGTMGFLHQHGKRVLGFFAAHNVGKRGHSGA